MLHYIHDYRRRLDDLRWIAGAENEGTLSPAFAGLLEDYGREHQLILAREGTTLRADGVLLDRLRLAHGWWEAKDSKDQLDREMEAKLRKGYLSDNILFEDTVQAVLVQNGQETRRVLLANDAALAGLLNQFFAFRPPEVAQFEQAAGQFRRDLPTVMAGLAALIAEQEAGNATFQARLGQFHALCVRAIGERVTSGHVREMLIQHVLTEQIFRDLFPLSAFHRENHLARALDEVEQAFLRGETRHNLLRRMEPYYAAIRRAAANAIAATEKQEFLKAVYEDFYTAYNPKDADRMGIVYTPAEVVRFIIQGCETLARAHFGRGLADEGLDILDPCTGTGTFIVELLEFLRGDRAALAQKYAGEIHANEIAILPYYIAGLNWINQPKNDWSVFLKIGDKLVKFRRSNKAIFEIFSPGLVTARDEWIYTNERKTLTNKVQYFLIKYESNLKKDSDEIKWSESLKIKLQRGKIEKFSDQLIIHAFYRSFIKKL